MHPKRLGVALARAARMIPAMKILTTLVCVPLLAAITAIPAQEKKAKQDAIKKEEQAKAKEEKAKQDAIKKEENDKKKAEEKAIKDEENATEMEDDEAELQQKVVRLAEMLRAARHTVIYTGAGVSTSASMALPLTSLTLSTSPSSSDSLTPAASHRTFLSVGAVVPVIAL